MKSIESRLKKAVNLFYENHNIPLDSSQLIALSGGCDSVALLVLLHDICPFLQAAYFNHNLRDEDELNQEMDLVRSLCTGFHIPLHLGEIPRGYLNERVEKSGLSLEDAARNERYQFLESLMEEMNGKYLVLGHHGDDQSETILSRFFQGSGPAGLTGIRPVNGKKIRPLLRVSKNDLIRYLLEKGISWSEDRSNAQVLFQRNQIRNILIPALKTHFPGLDGSLVQLSEKMSRIDNFLEKESLKVPWQKGNSRLYMALSDFNSLHPALREYSLWAALDQLLKGSLLSRGRGKRIPHRFIRPFLDKDLNPSFFQRGYGLSLYVKEEYLILEKEENKENWDSFFYLERGKHYLFYHWMVEWCKIGRPDGKSVVLLLEKDEIPQVRELGKSLVFDSHRGEELALWNGDKWHIRSRNLQNASPWGVIIREHSKHE